MTASLSFDQMMSAAATALTPLTSYSFVASQQEDILGVCQCDKAADEQQIINALEAAGLGDNQRIISFSGRGFGYQVTVYEFAR